MIDHHHNGGYSINWELGLEKFLTKEEIRKLRYWVKLQRERNHKKHLAWFEWFLIELGLNTGLRVFEMAELKCGDIVIRGELSHVFVRKGKCNKSREVRINSEFCQSVVEYLKWKHECAGQSWHQQAGQFSLNKG